MDVNEPLDNLDKLRGIPSKELFEKLLSDSAFVEYLNTFLSLPVFGKRLTYNPAKDNFSIDPPPPRTCYHLPHYRVKKWVRKERLHLFWKTDLFLEYLLYVHLKKAAGSSGTSVDLDQTRTYLGTVEGMRTFHRFLRGTSGQKILLFWIEAERFRRVTKKEHRRFAFRDIQAKYLCSGSPRELPEIMKWISICGATPDLERKSSFKFPKSVSRRMYLSEASIFSGNVFIPGQRMALERLISYWVPKYIEHKKRLERFIEEKRCRQSVFRPEIRRFSPVQKVEQEIPLSKTKSQEEIDEFMEAQCVSSTESVTETEEEIRTRKLEEWKRWFWEGVDYNLTGSEDQVEPPDDMPLELRRLGGIREATPSSPVTPEPDDASLSAIGEEEENEMFPDWQSLEDGSERIVGNSLSFPNPPTSRPITPLEEKSISEPAFATADFMRWRKEEEKPEQKAAEKKESLEEKRLNLPKLRPPYAQIPSSASTKLKTMYEALASEQSLMTEELYESSPESCSPFRSLEASPPLSALLALRRVSASRVIPFKEIGHEIAAMVNEPRNVYPWDTPQRERLVLFKSDTDISVSDEPSLPTLVALTADKLAGGPLREYLEKTHQDQALSSLQFWEDAQRYLSPSEDFGSYNKYHSAKTLIATYIAPGSPRLIEMSVRVRDDLMRLLPEEKGDHLLSSFVKKSVQAVALQWSEYVRSDEDHFISSVGIRRKSASKKKYISSVTKPEGSALQKWRALKLAVSLGVSGFSLGQGDEDEDESEAVGNDFVIPSLRDYEKEKEIMNARSKRPSHFYGHVTRQGADESEGNKKLTGMKMRPPKPRYFIDVIHDSLQLMWFKRFLTEKQCEAPLLFWQAVENMKMNCKDGKARQARAMTIVKKYFTNIPATAVEYLHCKAEIIKDIPLLDKATPPMLVSAQACVARSMEENWYAEYLATFPEDEGEGENFTKYAMRNTLAGVYKMAAHGKTKGLWAMFAHNVMCFQRGIHNSESLQEFKQFLRKECKATVEHNLRRHALHPTRRVINSKFVNTDRLISDIEFWMEVERFKYQAENAAECARSGNYTLEDENLLLEKARTIVKCYIDSDIPPRIQINIPNDLADNVVGLVQNGIVERGLFHEAALSVFTALMYFWKKFSAERTSKLEEEVQPPSTGKRANSRKRIMSAIDGIPYRKVYVANEEEVHWSFSLNHGLRLLIPLCKFFMAKQVATQMDQCSQPLSDNVSLSGSTP